jgi:hypothetical protein
VERAFQNEMRLTPNHWIAPETHDHGSVSGRRWPFQLPSDVVSAKLVQTVGQTLQTGRWPQVHPGVALGLYSGPEPCSTWIDSFEVMGEV